MCVGISTQIDVSGWDIYGKFVQAILHHIQDIKTLLDILLKLAVRKLQSTSKYAPPPHRHSPTSRPTGHPAIRPRPRPPGHTRPPAHPTIQPRPSGHPATRPSGQPAGHPATATRPPGHPATRPPGHPATRPRPPDHGHPATATRPRPPGHGHARKKSILQSCLVGTYYIPVPLNRR